MIATPDHYETLGLTPDATDQEVREAYRARARELHPDVHGEERKEWAGRRFRELQEAYEVLRDPESRRRYDATHAGGERIAHGSASAVPHAAACFYHAGRTARAVCPSCRRALCPECGDGSGPCRVCGLAAGGARPAETLPEGTVYASFARPPRARDETADGGEEPARWLRGLGLACYPLMAGAAAFAWVALAVRPTLGWAISWALLVGVTVACALAELWLLMLPSRRTGRVFGIAWEVLLVGAVVAWAAMPHLGDRFAATNARVAEACYARAVLLTRGAATIDASNAQCAAAWEEIEIAERILRGERHGMASVARGYGEQFGSFLTETAAPRVDAVGARAALDGARRHLDRAVALRPEGPGLLGRQVVERLEQRIAEAEAADRASRPVEGAPDGP